MSSAALRLASNMLKAFLAGVWFGWPGLWGFLTPGENTIVLVPVRITRASLAAIFQSAKDHGVKQYWCVFCEHCHPLIAIPLLEYDPTKQKQNPHDFQATCHRCEVTSVFDETELEIRKFERVPAFQSADGFHNVSK